MLEIKELTKVYGSAHGLRDLNLVVDRGEVLCVVGPSGCGKSTLLKLVSGLETPDAGWIRIAGELVASARFSLPAHRRSVNMVFQDYALWPHMRVRAIIGYGLNRLPKAERTARVDGLLNLLQLERYAERYPRELSGGQQQRVAIARAIATEPDVLLFDEPLSNLDVQLRLEMRHELTRLFRRLGKTVLYVTHDPMEACAFADRLLVLREGRLEQLSDTLALFRSPASPWVAALAGYDSRLCSEVVSRLRDDLCVARVAGQELRVRLNGSRSPAPGESLTVMLHSATVACCDTPTAGDEWNWLQGRVTQAVCEGRGWRLRLALAGETLSLLSSRYLEEGALVTVRFPVAETLGFRPDAASVTSG